MVWEKHDTYYDIRVKDIPSQLWWRLRSAFSSRTEQILNELRKHDLSKIRRKVAFAKQITLMTRPQKRNDIDLEILREIWTDKLRSYGLSLSVLAQLKSKIHKAIQPQKGIEDLHGPEI